MIEELPHGSLQHMLLKLTVSDANANLGNGFLNHLCDRVNSLNLIVDKIDLSATIQFSQNRFANHLRVKFADVGFHRQSVTWRRFDYTQVAYSH